MSRRSALAARDPFKAGAIARYALTQLDPLMVWGNYALSQVKTVWSLGWLTGWARSQSGLMRFVQTTLIIRPPC